MIDQIFDGCVRLLIVMAHSTGTTYKAINVWIFCVAWPLLTVALFAVVFHQQRRLRALRTA